MKKILYNINMYIIIIIMIITILYLFVDITTNAAPSGLGQPAVVKRHPKKLIGNRFRRKIYKINII